LLLLVKQISYITLIDKSLPNFRPQKFEQRHADSLSLIVGRYLILAQRTALKNVVLANRPECKPILMFANRQRGESTMG